MMLRHNDVRKEDGVERIGHSFSLATHFSTLQRRNYIHVTKHNIKMSVNRQSPRFMGF